MSWRIKPIEQYVGEAQRKPLPRSLGPVQLTMLGVGNIIGTGIFVLTAIGAERAGPGLILSFIIAGGVCAFAALVYAELAAMVPVAGSAYAYSYVSMGEFIAWLVGWNLILEYTVAAAVVAVGWAGYVTGFLDSIGIELPATLKTGALAGQGGILNITAISVVAIITVLLVLGTRVGATFGSLLVAIKLCALMLFIVATLPAIDSENLHPFMPYGFGATEVNGVTKGVMAAAALIFFSYLGFDAVSTAAEETRNPNRNVPIAVMGSLSVCTVIYILVAAGTVGTTSHEQLAGSTEPLALVLRNRGLATLANFIAAVTIIALPTVILMLLYAQSRVFFAMARDRLLPPMFSRVHARFRTPHIVTIATSVLIALLAGTTRAQDIAELTNAGTLFAFVAVSGAMVALRISQPHRPRPFRCPWPIVVASTVALGSVYLFYSLSWTAQLRFFVWTSIGSAVYFTYRARRHAGTDRPTADAADG